MRPALLSCLRVYHPAPSEQAFSSNMATAMKDKDTAAALDLIQGATSSFLAAIYLRAVPLFAVLHGRLLRQRRMIENHVLRWRAVR